MAKKGRDMSPTDLPMCIGYGTARCGAVLAAGEVGPEEKPLLSFPVIFFLKFIFIPTLFMF